MQNIAISTRTNIKNPEDLKILLRELKKWGKNIFLSENARKNISPKDFSQYQSAEENEHFDMIIIIGGDGTILSKVQKMKSFQTPIFAINGGNLGFLASIFPSQIPFAMNSIFEGHYTKDERMMLSGKIIRAKGSVEKFHALNECTLHHSGIARLREIETHINKEHLTTYRADGLIISTPTGSTAYNVSAGGPIIVPSLSAFVITPLAPSGFAQRSIVIPSEKKITLQVCGKNSEMSLSIDGQIAFEISGEDRIEIKKHPQKITFLRLLDENFYISLREKLGWGL